MNLYQEIARYEKWLRLNCGGVGSKIDYSYKADVLDHRLDKIMNKIGYSIFCHHLDEALGCITLNILDRQSIDCWLEDLYSKYGLCSLMEAYRINNARYHRVSRLKKRVESIISYKSYFLTLTFNDDCLNNTSVKTRREYVTRYLKSLSTNYVGNIDFGARNHREHYHALVQCDSVSKDLWKDHGFMDIEEVYIEDNSIDKLSKYVAKLTNHAIKETTKRSALIYPKNNS